MSVPNTELPLQSSKNERKQIITVQKKMAVLVVVVSPI